jgi:hypothetical protein
MNPIRQMNRHINGITDISEAHMDNGIDNPATPYQIILIFSEQINNL